MLNAIIQGALLGLVLTVMLGPVFFAHLQTVIYKGYVNGLILLAGIISSDIALIVLSYFGFAQYVTKPENGLLFGIIGGVVLVLFGLYTYRRKVKFSDMRPKALSIKAKGIYASFLKGFFLNLANPFVWIFWLGVVSVVSSAAKGNTPYIFVFFIVFLSVYVFLSLAKTFLAYKVKRLLRPRLILILNRIVGIAMVVFGVVLMLKVFLDNGNAAFV